MTQAGVSTAVALSIPPHELARLCEVYGASLNDALKGTDDGNGKPIDGPSLLWAMAGRESNFGRNLRPRHEPAYDSGGRYAIAAQLERWGSAWACSYGPLQIMACNAHGFTPAELACDPDKAMQAAVSRLRVVVLGQQKARTIDAICDCWNSGNAHDGNVPHEYIAAVRHFYFTEII